MQSDKRLQTTKLCLGFILLKVFYIFVRYKTQLKMKRERKDKFFGMVMEDSLYRSAYAAAVERGVSIAALIRAALVQYISNQKK